MGKVLMCGTSGGVTSDDVTAKRSDVLAGKKTITADSNDEIVEGTIIDRGQYQTGTGLGRGTDYYAVMNIPEGLYKKDGLEWAPEARLPKSVVRDALNASNRANWRASVTIADQTGTMPEQGGSTIVPGTANKTAIGAGRYVSGNIIVSGDPNLVPANIKKGVRIFGVNGAHDGFVPGPMDVYNRGTWGPGYGIGDVKGIANVGSVSTTNNVSAIQIKQSGVADESTKSNAVSFRIYKPINLISYKTINFIVSGLLAYNWGYNGSSGTNLNLTVYSDSSFSKSIASSMREFRFSSPNYTETTFSLDISGVNIPSYISITLVNISDYSNGGSLYGNRINTTSYIHRIWFT